MSIVIMLAASYVVMTAAAVHTEGTFELNDGDVVDSPAGAPWDWAALFDAAGTPISVGAPIVNSGFADDNLFGDVACPGCNADATTHGSNKDIDDINGNANVNDDWQCVNANNVLNKNDILNAYATIVDGPAGSTFLYLGVEKDEPNGNNFIGFWLFKTDVGCTSSGAATPFTGQHELGDLFILGTFTNGGQVSNISIYRWNTAVAQNLEGIFFGVDCQNTTAGDQACGRVNGADINTPWKPGDAVALETGTFFEAGVNLTALLGADLPCFASFLAETRASQSFTAELHDFAGGSFSTCDARISITPQTGTNLVGQDHLLTVLVEKTTGGAFDPAAGVTVFLNITSGPGNFLGDDGTTTCVTDGSGQCSVTLQSSVAGTTTVNAAADVGVSGDVIHVETDGQDDNSGPATKTWIKRDPPMGTTSSPTGGSVVPGTSVSDTATVSAVAGLPTPTGTVTFFLCQPSEVTAGGCEGSAGTQIGSAVSLVAGVATSDSTSDTNAIGTYCWRAAYGGDGTYNATSHTNSTTECFTTATLPSSTDTTSNPTGGGVLPGTSVTDTATISGSGATPTGDVTFFLCQPSEVTAGGCEGSAGTQIGSAVSLVGGSATSDATTDTLTPGTYCWRAEYGGDDLYDPSNHTNADSECFTVEQLPPDISTSSSEQGTVIPGTSVSDTATVSGSGPVPTGDVTFFLCGPSEVTAGGCEGSAGTQIGGPVTLDGSGEATSDSTVVNDVGDYCWRVAYEGDDVYTSGSHTNNGTECFEVAKQPSTTVTTPSSSSIDLGGSVSDHAVVTGDFGTPTGTVDFFLCAPSELDLILGTCEEGGTLVSDDVPLNATGEADSDPFTPTEAGTWCWRAEYSGDTTYFASEDSRANECFEVVEPSVCPHTIGYWKTHEEAWIDGETGDPITELTLGDQVYTKEELLDILNTPGNGDASVILAKQLIGAKLSILVLGSGSGPVDDAIANADALLSGYGDQLPYHLKTNKPPGSYMVENATILDDYNNGILTAGCNADVGVEKQAQNATATASSVTIQPGEDAVFLITVSSNGPGSATSVTLDDELPAVSGAWGMAGDTGGCSLVGTTLHCAFGTLAAGASRALTLTASTDETDAGALLDNTAVVATAGVDNDDGNNEASASIAVGEGAAPEAIPEAQPEALAIEPAPEAPVVAPVEEPAAEEAPARGRSADAPGHADTSSDAPDVQAAPAPKRDDPDDAPEIEAAPAPQGGPPGSGASAQGQAGQAQGQEHKDAAKAKTASKGQKKGPQDA
ncbi:MAG TPA: Ig-like domain repeat protein [Candidatus Thermoplasmatota archaeon]|jgi:hypothetical protein|nr:Ig-like domain repeat protein [Candidatus Thermoplasmatota archaeon]